MKETTMKETRSPRAWGVVAVGAILLLGACDGDDGTSRPVASPSPTLTMVEPPPAVKRLEPFLLTKADVPEDFKRQITSFDPQTGEVCGVPIYDRIEARSQNRAIFARGEATELIVELVASYEAGRAQAFMDIARAAATSCTRYPQVTQGERSVYTIKALQLPQFGDESFGAVANVVKGSPRIKSEAIYIRSGDLVATILYLSFGPPLEKGLTRELAARAAVQLESSS